MKKAIVIVSAIGLLLSVNFAMARPPMPSDGTVDPIIEMIINWLEDLQVQVNNIEFPTRMDVDVLSLPTPVDVNVVSEPPMATTQWEYYLINLPGYGDIIPVIQEQLNIYGPQGWELVDVSQEYDGPQIWYTMWLKRPTSTTPLL